jgi:hypothetical protein
MALGVLGLAAPAYAAAPSNDLISNATVVSTLPYTDSSSTVEATHSSDEPTDCTSAPSIWYRYTPSANEFVQADTIGSGFDTKLAAFSMSRRGALVPLGCDDDSAGYPASLLRLQLTARTTYYFMVSGYDVYVGSTVFHLFTGTEPEVSVDVTGTVDTEGSVSLTLSVACGTGTTGSVTYIVVTQEKRGTYAPADANVEVACGGTTTLSLVSSTPTPFRSGRAVIDIYGDFGSADLSEALTQLPQQAVRLAAAR